MHRVPYFTNISVKFKTNKKLNLTCLSGAQMGWINEIKNAKRSRDTATLMSVVIYGKRLSFDVFRFQITHYITV